MPTIKLFSAVLLLGIALNGSGQVIPLNTLLDSIQTHHPAMKMFDAEIRSMDVAATGAKSWMAPELATGFWMAPYNTSLWQKSSDGMQGMGQYMVSAQQMIPNKKKLSSDAAYMEAMSSVATEKKKATLNDLFTEVKKNYVEWIIIDKKINILNQNEALLNFMIQNAEIRYKNGLDKISAYYKAKAAAGNIQNMKLMLQNEKLQKRVAINTILNRDPQTFFEVDTNYVFKDYSGYVLDSSTFFNSRSDIKAINQEIHLAQLKQETERQSLKPQFGVRYDHMFGFGGLPTQFSLMGMVRLPMVSWSSRMYTAKIESLNWESEALNQQKKMLANEYGGMASNMINEIDLKKKQMQLFEKNIMPALNNNYQTMLLGYEQNTEELFMLYDAWETLNMTQLEYVQLVQDLLMMQVQLDSLLELR